MRRSEERLRSVVENVVDGIVTFDDEGVIESFNPGAERLFGYAAGDVIGRNVEMLIADSSAAEGRVARRVLRRLLAGQSEIAGRRRDDSLFLMEFAASEFRLGDRRLFTGIVRDVTERKLLEEELRHRAEQLAEADRRKDEFLAMLAHELRNPLAPIRHSLSILAPRARDDAELYTTWDVVDRQVEHLTRLVDDLLDVSRITSGKVELQKETTDVADAVKRAAAEARPFIDARRLTLTVSLPADPLRVEADPVRLTQVLNNLLNNAAKYTEPGGVVTIGAERRDGHAVLVVRDTGVGIAPEFLPRVFDLFSQQDSSLARTRGGLGVGLTLVRNLVEMHGGSVEAESDGPGKGSTFVVRLPLVDGSAPAVPRSERIGDHAPLPGRRVLIVDDNADSAETLAILLRRFGHEVRTAADGASALELARREPPDVALLDIGLPIMDGLELARRMREDLGLTRAYLIALTGYGQEEDRRKSRAAGFDAHLVKPVDLDRLRRILTQPAPGAAASGEPIA
jgi:PAS domain S-box-containing protein